MYIVNIHSYSRASSWGASELRPVRNGLPRGFGCLARTSCDGTVPMARSRGSGGFTQYPACTARRSSCGSGWGPAAWSGCRRRGSVGICIEQSRTWTGAASIRVTSASAGPTSPDPRYLLLHNRHYAKLLMGELGWWARLLRWFLKCSSQTFWDRRRKDSVLRRRQFCFVGNQCKEIRMISLPTQKKAVNSTHDCRH